MNTNVSLEILQSFKLRRATQLRKMGILAARDGHLGRARWASWPRELKSMVIKLKKFDKIEIVDYEDYGVYDKIPFCRLKPYCILANIFLFTVRLALAEAVQKSI